MLAPPPPPPDRRSPDVDELVSYIAGIGGIADRRGVGKRFTRQALHRALTDGCVKAAGRSRLLLASAAADVAAAHRIGGVLSHRTAAAWWGWSVLEPAPLPEIAVPRGRRVRKSRRGCVVHWQALPEDDVLDGATTPLRTVLDCAGTLPFEQALGIADAALRSTLVGKAELLEAADRARGRGARARRRVAEAADGRAESPFESAVRAVLIDVPGLRLVPQVEIEGPSFPGGTDFAARVDLADTGRRLVVEADSFEYHGGREGLRRDATRYDELVARGWRVIRVTYDDVLGNPEWVRAIVQATAEHAHPE